MEKEILFNKWLPCKLTDAEKLHKAATLSEKLKNLDEAQEAAATSARLHKDAVSGLKGEIGSLSRAIQTGEEGRNVECKEERDFEKKRILVRRLDTKEVISDKAMTQDEMQAGLPFFNHDPAVEEFNKALAKDQQELVDKTTENLNSTPF